MNKYILCTLITAITNCKTIDHTNDIDPQKVKELCTKDKAVQSFNYQQKHVEVPNNNELYTLKKEIPFEDCKQIKNRRWTDNKCLLSCDNKKLDKERASANHKTDWCQSVPLGFRYNDKSGAEALSQKEERVCEQQGCKATVLESSGKNCIASAFTNTLTRKGPARNDAWSRI